MYIFYSNGVLAKKNFNIPIDLDSPDYQEYLAWVAAGNAPELRDGSEWLTKLEQDKISYDQVKAEYQTMIHRLEQIQTATNPTTAQVVQAVKDEALYIERIMKVLRRILT